MSTVEGEVVKWGSAILAGVAALFTIKWKMSNELKDELKLRFDLIQTEIAKTNVETVQVRVENARLEKLIQLRLVEKEHDLICQSTQREIMSIKGCIEDGFNILHKRIDEWKN